MDQFHIFIKMKKKFLIWLIQKISCHFCSIKKLKKKEIQLQLTKLIFKLVDIKLNKIEAVAILSCKKNTHEKKEEVVKK